MNWLDQKGNMFALLPSGLFLFAFNCFRQNNANDSCPFQSCYGYIIHIKIFINNVSNEVRWGGGVPYCTPCYQLIELVPENYWYAIVLRYFVSGFYCFYPFKNIISQWISVKMDIIYYFNNNLCFIRQFLTAEAGLYKYILAAKFLLNLWANWLVSYDSSWRLRQGCTNTFWLLSFY
jgi:hypothetical protein